MAIDKFRRTDVVLDKANSYILDEQFGKVGDIKGRDLVVQITDDGVIQDQSGIKLVLAWTHNQVKNTGIEPFEELNVQQGIFKVTYPAEMMNEGTVTANIGVVQENGTTFTRNFTLRVEKNAGNADAAITSDSWTVLFEALEKVNEAEQLLKETIAGLEAKYGSSIGDMNIFRKWDTTLIDKMNNEFGERGINVKWFGAAGDGVTDDTVAIQAAIDAFANSKSNQLVLSGMYKVSKTGIDGDNRPYAIKVDGLDNKIVDLTNAKFVLDLTDDMPNVFSFLNCNDITVIGGYAEANFKETEGHPLYYGSFIYGKSCTNLSVYRTHAHNMVYGVCLFRCSQGQLTGNKFTHDLINYDRKFRPMSAILLKDTTSYHVSSNDITGGLRDGDLSIFGGGSYANVVTGNHLRGLAWEEAITVDGGARKTIVSNNVIEGGYNYGIDIKYNAENTLAIGNTIEKCVVGIADRGGEIGANANVFQTIIHDNNIIFGNVPSTQGWGDHRQTGIGIDRQYGADIKGNHLTLGRKYDVNYPIYGIMVSQPASPVLDFISQADISNNFIELKNGIDGDYQIAGDGSTALYLDTIKQGNITNNDIKAPARDLAVKIVGKNNVIKFSANHFITDGITAIQYYGDAGCNNLIITEDNYYQMGNLTNAYMYQTTYGNHNQTYILSQKTFGSAKANPFFFITSKWSNTLIVHVDMQYDNAGLFLVDSTFRLNIDTIKGTINITPIDEHNSDVELSAINISNNMFGVCAKATRDCPDNSNQSFKVTVKTVNNTNVYS